MSGSRKALACLHGLVTLLLALSLCTCARVGTPPATTLAEPSPPLTATSVIPAPQLQEPIVSPTPHVTASHLREGDTADFGCLAYYSQGPDTTLWVLTGSAPPQVLVGGARGWISQDGRYVACIRGFPEELWVIFTDGSEPKLLYKAPMGSPLLERLLLAPDGTTAVFSLTCPGCPASQDPGALWRIDIPLGTVQQLAHRGALWPLFSPDSRWLSVASPFGTLASHGSLGLMDMHGHGDVALFEFVSVHDRAWASDSTGFAVALQDLAVEEGDTELWWIPTSGPAQQLGRVTDVADLSWQPGAARLVYRKWLGDGARQLYLANRDGSEEVLIGGSEGLFPRAYTQLPHWSPDGRWLLTVKEDGSYYLLDTVGLSLHRLDVQVVYRWIDNGHFLASLIGGQDLERYRSGEEMLLDLYRCQPAGDCEWLARVPRSASFSYAAHCP